MNRPTHRKSLKGNRKRWARLRLRILHRDGYRCTCCGRAGRLEVDHIKPVHLGGSFWDPANLQSLARGCHILKTKSENKKRFAAENPRLAPKLEAWKSLVNALILPEKQAENALK